jgi:predicted NACHT family NTPase
MSSLVKNQDILLPREQAIRRIQHAMRGLRSNHAEPDLVLQRILERTGLLREVYDGQIQFVHRTFRDYLAAKEVVDSGDLDLLIDHAHLDQWHDVVIMSVAHARPAEPELSSAISCAATTPLGTGAPCTTGCAFSPRPAWHRPT